MTWTAAAGALAYHIQVDDSAAFDLPELDVTRPVSTSYTPTTALPYNIYYWHMQVQTASGWSNWTPVYRFTITPTLPVAPLQTSPATASITNDNTPVLNWNSVTNGVTYQVQISAVNTFVTTEQTYVLDPGILTYTASTLPDGIHYWRVRAVNYLNVSGAWSLIRYFTVDTVAQAIPAMSAPSNGATIQTTIPTLIVGAVTGAAYYQFQVDDANDFVTLLVDVTRNTTAYAIPIAQALPFGPNYWRVRSIDAAGNASGWSTPRSLVVTILYVPVDQSFTLITKPVLYWTAAAGALAYHIQVDDSAAFDLPELDVTRPVSTSYTPTTALPFNIYYWRMQVQTASGWSNWTPVYTFTVSPALLVAPVQNTPATGSITNDNTTMFNWNPVAGGISYQIQISTVNTFATLEQSVNLDPGVTTYTANTLPEGIHYWRVRAINYLNVPGVWSLIRYFTVDTVAPGIPTLSYPATGQTIRGTPRYTWLAVTGAVYYQYVYAVSPDFSDIVFTSGDLAVPYLIPPAQTPGTYNWHVRARDIAGNWGGWSSTRQVTIIP